MQPVCSCVFDGFMLLHLSLPISSVEPQAGREKEEAAE